MAWIKRINGFHHVETRIRVMQIYLYLGELSPWFAWLLLSSTVSRSFSARLPFSAQRPLLFLQGSLWETGVNLMLAVNPYRTEQPKADSTDALVPVPPVQISPSDLWRRGWRYSKTSLLSFINAIFFTELNEFAKEKTLWESSFLQILIFLDFPPWHAERLFPLVTSYDWITIPSSHTTYAEDKHSLHFEGLTKR